MSDQDSFDFYDDPKNREPKPGRPPQRKRDLAFETLVQVTHENIAMGRGKVNVALAAIRYAWKEEGGLEEDLPREIELRAEAYREMWPGITLTPTALASHWKRVMAQREEPKKGSKRALDELQREDDGTT